MTNVVYENEEGELWAAIRFLETICAAPKTYAVMGLYSVLNGSWTLVRIEYWRSDAMRRLNSLVTRRSIRPVPNEQREGDYTCYLTNNLGEWTSNGMLSDPRNLREFSWFGPNQDTAGGGPTRVAMDGFQVVGRQCWTIYHELMYVMFSSFALALYPFSHLHSHNILFFVSYVRQIQRFF